MPASKAASATRACTRSPVLSHCENDSTSPTSGHEKLSLADRPLPTCQYNHPIQSARGMTGTRAAAMAGRRRSSKNIHPANPNANRTYESLVRAAAASASTAHPVRCRRARLTDSIASATAKVSAVTNCTDSHNPRLPSTPSTAHQRAPSSDVTSARAAVATPKPTIDHTTNPVRASWGGSSPNPPASHPYRGRRKR